MDTSLWKYGEKLRKQISIYTSIIAAILTMASSFLFTIDSYKNIGKIGFWYPFDADPVLWLPIIILLFVILIMVLFMGVETATKIVKNKKSKEIKREDFDKLVDEEKKQ